MTMITKSNTDALAEIENLGVMNHGGEVVVSSRDVARVFEKEHKDVLKAIRNTECSEEFCRRNFALTSKTVAMPNGGTRKDPEYLITRDGFAILAMGFTGPKAMQFKEAYIARFNAMERELTRLREKELRRKILPSNYELLRQKELKQILICEYIEDRCEIGEGYGVKSKKLYGDFRDWCFESGYKPIKRECEFFLYIKQIRGIDGDKFNMTGIKLR